MSEPAYDEPYRAEPLAGPRRGTGRRLHGAIANHLGTAILSGKFAPGQVLTGEVAFSEALDVSRSAYREAIRVLAAKGLVESRPKAGTRVLPRSRWNLLDPDVLSWAFADEPDVDFVRDLFELRAIIEPAAAALAAERRDDAELAQLRASLETMRKYGLGNDKGRAADRDFHSVLLQATRNDVLVALSASIAAAVSMTTQFKQRSRQLPRDPIPDHARVCDAIADRDTAAASTAMRVLVDLALVDTRAVMEDR